MKYYKLSISEFINLIDSKQDPVCFINNYLINLISKKISCSKEDLELLKEKVKNLECINDKNKNKIFFKIELLSNLDYIMETESELSLEEIKKYNEQEILNFLKYLNVNKDYFFNVQLLVKQYLDISSDLETLCNILDNNAYLSKNNIKFLHNYICDNSLNRILIKITEILDNDEISFDDLNYYLSIISNLKLSYVNEESINLLKNILNLISDNNFLIKIDKVEFIYDMRKNINSIYTKLIENLDNESKIRNDIMSGDIILSNHYSNILHSKVNLDFDKLPMINDDRIITIDDPNSPDLDGAFSIQKVDNIYILNVFIADVPTFLAKNRKLCEEAYLRGTSMYFRENNKNYNIDMLPPLFSHKYLSLNLGYNKNVITFNFVISEDGVIYSTSVDRNRIIVTDKLSPQQALNIIESKKYYGLLQEDLRNYKELCKIISKSSKDKYLSQLRCSNIMDLIALPSVLTNYSVGHEASFAIYRNNGIYTKNKNGYYTHSTTPIRRFVSNINLAFFLEQNGLTTFSNKDLNYVETHVDEIIEHLNARENIAKFVESNPGFVKKYVK